LNGEVLDYTAAFNMRPEAYAVFRRAFPARLHRGSIAARAILDRAIVNIPDLETDPEYTFGEAARAAGFRSNLAVPMLREGTPIGVIVIARARVGLFSNREIELLQTFADQAVIAIENARLLTELQARTAELQGSVGQLTALGEVGQAVSSS